MTRLKRVLISLPRDLEAEINKLKEAPEFQEMPTSKIVCGLIRRGVDAMRQESASLILEQQRK